ncbi:MAG: Uma2 family endonuclease [Isosphaeraceae bacterium]
MSTVKFRIGPRDAGRKMSLEEFREVEGEPGYLYELARGVLEVVEIPADDHGQIVDNLHEMISRYRRLHPGLIRRICHGSDIRLLIPELDSDRHPDLAIVFRSAPKSDRGRQVPQLVSEVVSPGARARRRDYEEKAEEFLRMGIDEYWIVDPKLQGVTVLTRVDDPAGPRWNERYFAGDDMIESALLADFQGRVSELWIDAEIGEDETRPDGG